MKSVLDFEEVVTYKSRLDIFKRCITIGFGGFMYGYVLSELSVLVGALNILFQISDSSILTSQILMVSMMSLGAFIISLVSNQLINRWGRRIYIMVSDVVFIVGAGIGMIGKFYAFVVARFVMGVAIGMNSNVVSMYIREVSPDSISGITGSIFQIQINCGIIAGIVLSIWLNYGAEYIQENYCAKQSIENPNFTNYEMIEECHRSQIGGSWRLVIAFPCIFSLFRLFVLKAYYKLDTPYYYYSKENFDEGLQVLKEIYLENCVDIISENIINSLPKKIRTAYQIYTRTLSESQRIIGNKILKENLSEQSQNQIDVTSNSNLNYEPEDEYFNEQANQYPLDGLELPSDSQLNFQFDDDRDQNKESFNTKAQELKFKSLRRRMWLGFALNLLQQLTGINVVIQYTITIVSGSIKDKDNEPEAEINKYSENNNIFSYITLMSYIYLLFAAIIGSTLNRQFGRKKYLTGGYAICCLLHTVLFFVNQFFQHSSQQISLSIFLVVFVFVFYGTFNCSIGPVTWIYTSDILKGKYLSFAVACNWFGVVLSSLFQIFNTSQLEYSFLIFACCSGVGIFVSRLIIETEGKSYYEIIMRYAKKS